MVKVGQVVETKNRPWTYISMILLFILMPALNIFLPKYYNIFVIVLLAILYLGLYLFIDGLQLKKIYPSYKSNQEE